MASYEQIRQDCDRMLSVKIPDTVCFEMSRLDEKTFLAFIDMLICVCERDEIAFKRIAKEFDSTTARHLSQLAVSFLSSYHQENSSTPT